MDVRIRVLGAALLVLIGARVTLAETLDTTVQQRIIAATFEVVQQKPPEGGPVTYERDLPMDLIPYQQRVDKYRSVGTAFAIGANRYVTAGHVLSVGQDSQYGPPALRDSAGSVYEIDRVLKYSDGQDFVEFSLKHPPSAETVLNTAAAPPLNDAIFAVGNALGQGVVIRDGVFTSETPEESNGRWKWLRFTAAASPGNSGGPLVDKNGNVIGIVLRKSESENLNYAAPISLVAAASDKEGVIDTRANFKVPIVDVSEVIENHDTVALPASLADFYAAIHKITHSIIVRDDAQVLGHNKDRLFPTSASSAALLTEVARSPFPRMIREGQDRNWVIANPQIHEARLDDNGLVRSGGFQVLLRAPDSVKLATLYADSKLYMDLMLRGGYTINRRIGTASIKVTSLGKAREEFSHTDAWGRIWQVKTWAVPHDDTYLLTMSLPTPDGYAALFIATRSALKDVVLEQQKILADYTYVTLEGSLSRWREYLQMKALQPKVFGALDLGIDADFRSVHFASKRLQLNLTPEVMPLTPTTILALNFAFYRDGAAVVWDVGGILLGENAGKNEYVDVHRHVQPAASLPDNFQNNWKRIQAGEFPFNGVAADENGGMKVSLGVGPSAAAGGASGVRYVLTVRNEGAPGQDAMHARLDALQKAFKDLEH